MGFYKELIMDHYRNPRNRFKIANPDFSTEQFNPSCGDSIAIQGTLDGDLLKELAFEGKGCVISQASASILTEFCVGKTIDEVLALRQEDLPSMLGMQLGSMRIKCALLPLLAIQEGVSSCKKK